MKKIVYFTVFLFLLIAISGCGNNHNENRRRAEEHALRAVQGQTFYPYHTVERTTYDEETGEFTVYVSPIEEGEDEIRVVIRFLGDGSLWIDRERMLEQLR